MCALGPEFMSSFVPSRGACVFHLWKSLLNGRMGHNMEQLSKQISFKTVIKWDGKTFFSAAASQALDKLKFSAIWLRKKRPS